MEQSRAGREQARFNLDQASAILKHTKDVLRKTTYVAPIDGIVSYIAVRVGENVVPGIQNAEGSFLMTISDMCVVTVRSESGRNRHHQRARGAARGRHD